MSNIPNLEIKFNDLEEKMWKKKMEEGMNELVAQLKSIDNQLLKDKNNSELVVKDFQKTTIKCKFGNVEFYRRRYKVLKNNIKKYVYLLDIYLGLGKIGQYSQSIVEMVVDEATEKSFRKTAHSISQNTNASIGHTAVRNILIGFSEKYIEKIEKEKLELYEKGYLEGNKSIDIVYNESDGIYISMQDRNKNKEKRKGKKLKSEIKIGIVHEGFEKRYSNDFKIVNKQMIATTKDAKYFKRLVDMTIGTTYKESDIKKIIINADGAGWCKYIVESAKERYQLDMFHIQRKISEAVKDEEYKSMMSSVVKSAKPEQIFNIIYNYKVELEEDKDENTLEKVEELEEYLKNNREGLLRYQYDLGLTEEMILDTSRTEYRNLGTEESQMYCGCRKRMKKNRTSWSTRGAEAMIKAISYKTSNLVEDLITRKMEEAIEKELSQREPEPQKVTKKKIGKIHCVERHNILQNVEISDRAKITEILRQRNFNEMKIIGN